MDGVETVLLPVRLRLNKHHFFGESISRVIRFRITVPKIFFFERQWDEFWIFAYAPDPNEFFHAGSIRFIDHINSHRRAVIKSLGRMIFYESESADGCRG